MTIREHRYRPRGATREIFLRRDPEILLSGPAGTGKSRACLEKVHAALMKYPGSRWLALRQTAVALSATGLVTFEKHVADAALATGEVEFFGGSAREPAGYRYANGSFLAVGGLDKPIKIMSTEYDGAYVQEATELNRDGWESVSARLRNGVMPYQQLIADCNPSHPAHFLKQRAEAGLLSMLESRHEDNPRLFDDVGVATEAGRAYLARLDSLTGVRYLRLRKGLWVAAEGVIYEAFDPALHVIDRFPVPDSWPRYWSVDFGYTNPFVLQMWAVDPDGRMYLYRELYGTGRLVEDWARTALDLVSDADPADPTSIRARAWREPKPKLIVCDHDAEGRATFERYIGRSTTPATKGVSDGIQIMQKRYERAGDGKPRVYFFRDATVQRDRSLVDAGRPASTVEEISAYVWDTSAHIVQGARETAIREVPLKKDDHGQDAKRYLAVELDRGRPRVRQLS